MTPFATAAAAQFEGSVLSTIVIVVASIFGLVFLFILLKYANLYVQALLAGAGVGLFDMFAMSLRKVDPAQIVKARIMLVQARLDQVSTTDLEAHYLAGGRVQRVVQALISADRARLKLQDFDLYEIHEAFAAQVLCTLRAWESEDYCRNRLGLDAPLGRIDPEKINPVGSSLATGHPFAATGARVVATAAKQLAERGGGRALVSICTAGGMGVVAIVER